MFQDKKFLAYNLENTFEKMSLCDLVALVEKLNKNGLFRGTRSNKKILMNIRTRMKGERKFMQVHDLANYASLMSLSGDFALP